jgi:Zn-dependent M28 family amino/carboxypeptidase
MWRAALLSVPAAAAAQRPACAPIPIDSAAMLHDVTRLADDSMRGREVGTRGDHQARDFIAARFDALGLERIGAGRIAPFPVARGVDTVTGYNVSGVVPGTRFRTEYIVVSAHFDHIGEAGHGQCRALGGDSICNGADDNASGTAALLQLAGYFMRHPVSHSLLFVGFDGEESGDVGSHAWVAAPPVPLDSIELDVNMDMVGRNVHDELFASGPDKYPTLAGPVRETVACSAITLTIGHDGEPGRDDWTDQSDQGAFNAQRIPFVYFGEEDHPDYHRPGDQVERLMPGFYAGAARDVADFIRRVDALTVRPQR